MTELFDVSNSAKAVPAAHPLAVDLRRRHDALLSPRTGEPEPAASLVEPEPDDGGRPDPNEEETMEETRTCTRCGEEKSLHEFSPRGRGWSKTCDACEAKGVEPVVPRPVPELPAWVETIREAAGDPTLSQIEHLAGFLRCEMLEALELVREIRGAA